MAATTAAPVLIGAPEHDRLHVMSFNVRLDRTASTQPGDPDHWPERRPLLIDLLEREQPTLLGVQEAMYGQLSALEEALPRHGMIGYGRHGGSNDEHAAILYDRTRFEVLGWDQFWLSDTPRVIGSATWGNTVTRVVVRARLRDLVTGRELTMVNTHFDHESEPARQRSAQAVIDLLQDGAPEGEPAIVTGDFNCAARGSAAYSALVTAGPLVDTWDVADQQLTPAWGTFPDYRDPVEGGERIDWLLTTPGTTVLSAAINTTPGAEGRFPSDHAPVQALLTLP